MSLLFAALQQLSFPHELLDVPRVLIAADSTPAPDQKVLRYGLIQMGDPTMLAVGCSERARPEASYHRFRCHVWYCL